MVWSIADLTVKARDFGPCHRFGLAASQSGDRIRVQQRLITLGGRHLSLWSDMLAEEEVSNFFERGGCALHRKIGGGVLAHRDSTQDFLRAIARLVNSQGSVATDSQEAFGRGRLPAIKALCEEHGAMLVFMRLPLATSLEPIEISSEVLALGAPIIAASPESMFGNISSERIKENYFDPLYQRS